MHIQIHNINRRFAAVIGTILLIRGLLGFVSSGHYLFDIFSTTPNHNLWHTIIGTLYIWVGIWAKRTAAIGWNKFLGWAYVAIALFGISGPLWMSNQLGTNTLADNIFNIVVAVSSLYIGYHAVKMKHHGISMMKALNWPFGKT